MIKTLKAVIKNFYSYTFLKFLFVGTINSINGVIFSAFYSSFIPYNFAFICGYISSLIISFVLNSYITFKEKMTLKRFIKFPLSYVPNFLCQYILVWIMVDNLGLYKIWAYMLSAIIAMPITFIIMKLFVYKEK